jgi:hypothetical protein
VPAETVVAGTAPAETALAGTVDEPSFEDEFGPSWELLDTADARRR